MNDQDLLTYLESQGISTRDSLQKALANVLEARDSDLAPVQIRDVEPLRVWLRSRYYNVMARSLYEYWEEEIADFIEKGYNEWVITGSIGTGKSTAALVTCLRKIYELSCYERPQRLFRLADMTKIFFAYLSVNIKQAELTGFGQIREQLDSTQYFSEHYARDRKITSVIRFPNDVYFIPGSDQISFIGTNLFGVVLDEMNFLRTKGGTIGDSVKAQNIYQEAADRRRSRFMYKGQDPGFSLLVSSSTVQTSFTASRIKAAEQATLEGRCTTKVTQTKLWEVKPQGTYSHRVFYVFNGSERDDAFIINQPKDLLDLIDDPLEKAKTLQAIQALTPPKKDDEKVLISGAISTEAPTPEDPEHNTSEEDDCHACGNNGWVSHHNSPQGRILCPHCQPLPVGVAHPRHPEYSGPCPGLPTLDEVTRDLAGGPGSSPRDGAPEDAYEGEIRGTSGSQEAEDTASSEEIRCPSCEEDGLVGRCQGCGRTGSSWVLGPANPAFSELLDSDGSGGGVQSEFLTVERVGKGSVPDTQGRLQESGEVRGEEVHDSFGEGGEQGETKPLGPPEKSDKSDLHGNDALEARHVDPNDLDLLAPWRKKLSPKKVSKGHPEVPDGGPTDKKVVGTLQIGGVSVKHASHSDRKPVGTQQTGCAEVSAPEDPPGSNPEMDRIWGYLPLHLRNSISRVPVDFRSSFDGDLYTALKNIAGMSIAPVGKLFTSRGIWARATKDSVPNPFRKDNFVLTMRGADQISDYFRADLLFGPGGEVLSLPYSPRYLRVDQSKNTDATGLACVHRAGWSSSTGVRMPVIAVDFVIQILPPPKPDKIGFHKIRTFILLLRDLGMKIGSVSFDQFQSEDHMQILELGGVKTSYLSVDRTDKAYLTVVNLLNEGRLEMYPYEPLRKEFFNLEWDRGKGKVDHPNVNPDGTKGTKDVCDAFVGAIFDCVNGVETGVPDRGELLESVRTVGPTITKRDVGKGFDWVLPKEYRGHVEIDVVKIGPESGGYDPERGYDPDKE